MHTPNMNYIDESQTHIDSLTLTIDLAYFFEN